MMLLRLPVKGSILNIFYYILPKSHSNQSKKNLKKRRKLHKSIKTKRWERKQKQVNFGSWKADEQMDLADLRKMNPKPAVEKTEK